MTKTKTKTRTKVAVAVVGAAAIAAAGMAASGMFSQGPDLMVKDVFLDDGNILTAVVMNAGKMDVPTEEADFDIYFYYDGALEKTYAANKLADQSYLAAGGQATITPEIFSGSGKVKVCVDVNEEVKETKERNNCKEKFLGDDQTSAGGEDEEGHCKDTDGGFEPYKFGIAQYGSVIGDDVCVLQADQGAVSSEVMACDSDPDPGCMLDEYVCKDDKTVGHALYKCEDYCYKGECRKKPDSDDPAGEPDPVDDPPDVTIPTLDPVDSSSAGSY